MALPMMKYCAGWCLVRQPLAALAAVLVFAGLAPSAVAQLPQWSKRIDLGETVAKQLRADLSGSGTASVPALKPGMNILLVNLLPVGIRDSCGKALRVPGSTGGRSHWSVRLLSTTREEAAVSALLVFRCTSARDQFADTPDYDERPAVLQLGDRAAFVEFIPLAERCEGCSDLYHVEFVDALPVEHGRLIELKVSSSNDTPWYDGIDHHGRTALLLVAMPQARWALQAEVGSWSDDCDSEGCSDVVCRAQVRHNRDGAGHVVEIVAVTTCTDGSVPKPPETIRYVWDPAAASFEKATPAKP